MKHAPGMSQQSTSAEASLQPGLSLSSIFLTLMVVRILIAVVVIVRTIIVIRVIMMMSIGVHGNHKKNRINSNVHTYTGCCHGRNTESLHIRRQLRPWMLV